MLRKLLVPALGLALLPAVAHAQKSDSDYGFNQGNWELTLAGSGRNNSSFEHTDFSAQGSLGYFLTDAVELGARQSVVYADDNGGSGWYGQTNVFADYHFDLGQFQPFVGANVGYTYGDTHNTWEGAPEAGLKYFLNHTTFVEGRVEYQFNFDEGGHTAFSEGAWVYSLALGVKF